MSVSASKSALVLSPCLHWASDSAREYDDELSNHEKRDKGTMFHAGMDGHYSGGDSRVRDLEVQLWVDAAVQWSETFLEPRCEKILSEVYVGYNFKSGYVHTDPTVHDRKYPKMRGFVPGTADLVCILKTGELLVADWKTGSGTGVEAQLLTLACGLRKVYLQPDGSIRTILLAALYAGETSDRCVHPVEWAVSESDLLAHEHAMAERLARVNKPNEPVVGIHCSQLYCPHLAYCAGIGAIVADMAESPKGAKGAPNGLLRPEALVKGKPERYQMTDMPISDEEAGFTMERAYAAKRQYEYLMAGIKRYVNGGGRAVAGDFEYKQTTTGFRWVKRV